MVVVIVVVLAVVIVEVEGVVSLVVVVGIERSAVFFLSIYFSQNEAKMWGFKIAISFTFPC